MSLEERYQQQVKIFERLVDLIVRLMNKFGRHTTLLEPGDYSVYDDYWGYPQVKVTVCKLDLLKPSVVKALQSIISKFPGWEIVVALYIRGGGENCRTWGSSFAGMKSSTACSGSIFRPNTVTSLTKAVGPAPTATDPQAQGAKSEYVATPLRRQA